MKNLIFISVFAFALIISGCSKKEEPKKETTGDDVKKEQTTDSKNESKDNDLGISAGLPSNFPSDLAQPKDSKCLGYLSTSEGTVVTFESNLSVKEHSEFYKNEMKKQGYSMDEGEEISTNDANILVWKKDSKEVSVAIAKDESSGKTNIVLTYK